MVVLTDELCMLWHEKMGSFECVSKSKENREHLSSELIGELSKRAWRNNDAVDLIMSSDDSQIVVIYQVQIQVVSIYHQMPKMRQNRAENDYKSNRTEWQWSDYLLHDRSEPKCRWMAEEQ